jgi:hypothetical protein
MVAFYLISLQGGRFGASSEAAGTGNNEKSL